MHRILFTNGILGIENVGGDLDAVTGKRVTFAFFPWNWDRGDGCIIRLVAIIDKSQNYRIENGAPFASAKYAERTKTGRFRRKPRCCVKRFADAKPYEAPNHRGVVGLRLQGFEPGGPTNQWVGYSQFLPGGGAGSGIRRRSRRSMSSSSGRMTRHRRRATRRCSGRWIPAPSPPNEVRELVNRDNDVCKMLVVIPYPPGAKP